MSYGDTHRYEVGRDGSGRRERADRKSQGAPSAAEGHRGAGVVAFAGFSPPDPGGGERMIGPGTGVRIYLACGATDMRKGVRRIGDPASGRIARRTGLAAPAQEKLKQPPASGAVFAFRGRRGDRVKLRYWE